uniref:Uncharacterized protein n=1 Tax=Meloidogyne enterolobii TaxID=390850 RepID=A0A6V7W8N8_MELEN|nr:unnamed protein product [Meloidogyne enterolobii]
MVYAPCLSTMQRWFRSTKKVKHEPTTNTVSSPLTTTLITPSPGTIATERKLLYLLADTVSELLEENIEVNRRLQHIKSYLGAHKFLCIR